MGADDDDLLIALCKNQLFGEKAIRATGGGGDHPYFLCLESKRRKLREKIRIRVYPEK